MSAIIKTLKTTTNDVEQSVYPKTVLEAVVDAETNETLDVILDNLNEKIDNIEPGGGGGGGTTYELSRTEDTITLTGSDGSSSEITDSSAYLSRENLLVYPYHDNTSTIYGVTFTVNNDGTITANGESTSSYSAFSISTRHADSNPLIVLPKGTYTLSGCPTGGGETTYCIQIGIDSNGSWKTIATDTGNGAIFTLTEETQIAINCPIMSGVTVENLIFKPMLEVGTVAHEYQPYNLSRQKLRSDLDSINTDLDTSDKVSKSGDTMTGDLTVKANINTPLLSDNSDTTIVTVPTAGTVNIGSTDKGITDVLTSYKSFIGSIHTKDAWNSVISVRHRNGVHDGSSHGMYLRSLMNTGNTNLIWNNQNAGTWESERTILDSGNYSSYALPLSGGTLTGAVKYGSYNMLEYNSTSTTVSNTNRPNMYFGNDNTRTVLRGQVYVNHSGTAPCTQIAWAVISDARLKENIINLTSTDDIKSKYIQLWDKVNPMEYNLTCNSNKKNLGYVAQDFIEAMEELGIDYEESSIVNIQPNEQIGEDGICSVSENSEYFEELYTLNYDECAMLTTLKVKQIVNEILPNMQAEIDALKEQNELLKEQIRLMKEGN